MRADARRPGAHTGWRGSAVGIDCSVMAGSGRQSELRAVRAVVPPCQALSARGRRMAGSWPESGGRGRLPLGHPEVQRHISDLARGLGNPLRHMMWLDTTLSDVDYQAALRLARVFGARPPG